ncbi:MAG TPA: hypothetical protein VEX15_20925 [Nocardioidaceae bacterium]|nr:hypothetical protein [Nocardioidaceae bacterium]
MNRLDALVRDTLDDRATGAPAAAPVISRVLADRSRRRRRGWLAVAATAAVTAAVVAVGVGVTRGPDAGGPAGVTTDTTDERTVARYSVALERFLRTSDWGAGGVPDEVYVTIRPDTHAGWDFNGHVAGDPIPADVRDEISERLADLTHLNWVVKDPTPKSGTTSEPAKAAVTLGLLADGDKVNVSVSAFYGFDNGWLQTYVVELQHGSWKVTGTDAPTGLT